MVAVTLHSTHLKINILHIIMEVWFRSFSFLFMGDGCRFQPSVSRSVYQLDPEHDYPPGNISPKNGILKMIFLFPRWDMLIPWRVLFWTQQKCLARGLSFNFRVSNLWGNPPWFSHRPSWESKDTLTSQCHLPSPQRNKAFVKRGVHP